ncbi:hypothetical protein MJI95_24025, partial [Salmonella enterica subsp. enterica serovar Kentucky]|nr:hypothetical protein [Salmonella enterica subsp. enterica serovar Kentucky]
METKQKERIRRLMEFDCGEASLNLFLTQHLQRQHNNKILRGYVLRTTTPERRVL